MSKPSRRAILKALQNLDKRGQLSYEVEILPEDNPIAGNYMATDDPEADRREEIALSNRLRDGDIYAWFYARVTVRWEGFSGEDALGACSYESREDFDKHCLPDMKHEALIALARTIADAFESISRLITKGA